MLSLLTLKEPTTNLWKGPRGKGLWVASGRQSNLWLASSKRTGVPSNTTVRKWTASGNSELTFPSWTSRWGHSWLALWSPALWAPEQRTQLKCTRFLSYGDREIINLYFSQLLSLRWFVLQQYITNSGNLCYFLNLQGLLSQPVLFFPVRGHCLSHHTEFGLMDSSSEACHPMLSNGQRLFTASRIKGPLDHISGVGRRTNLFLAGDSGAPVKMHQWWTGVGN